MPRNSLPNSRAGDPRVPELAGKDLRHAGNLFLSHLKVKEDPVRGSPRPKGLDGGPPGGSERRGARGEIEDVAVPVEAGELRRKVPEDRIPVSLLQATEGFPSDLLE